MAPERSVLLTMALSLGALLAACSSTSGGLSPGGSGNDGGVATDTACKTQYPASQTLSQGCCPGWGPDACGADLFCAALDGRTQPTCYPTYSRLPGQSCTDATQCTSAGCTASGVCEALPGTACDPSIGCGPGLTGTTQYYCGTVNGQSLCEPCEVGSIEPACTSSTGGGDGGSSGGGDGSSSSAFTVTDLCAAEASVKDAGANCTQCCVTDQAGAQEFVNGYLSCACTTADSAGGCSTECANDVCAGHAGANPACASCLTNSKCFTNLAGSCNTDTACKAWDGLRRAKRPLSRPRRPHASAARVLRGTASPVGRRRL